MKRSIIFSVLCISIFSGCSLRQREIELDKKLAEVNEKEQQLSLKEQSLDFREQQLSDREKKLDSTTRKIANDSLYILYPKLPGVWNVKMQCTETNCAGSAVGDIKNEQWEFKFQDNAVLASATSNNQLVRIYSGEFVNNSLRLAVQQDSSDTQSARILVRLQQTKDNEITGEREIIQPSGCRILYSLQLKKQ
jgi:hypothetical protein